MTPEVQESQELADLKKLQSSLEVLNLPAKLDLSIMRGFDYYTGVVFEVMDTNPENVRAMAGGGRYDGMVGLFGVEPLPTTGFAIGDVTLLEFLETNGLLPDFSSQLSDDVRLLLVGDCFNEASKLANQLRGLGLTVSLDFSGRKISKQLESAVKFGQRLVMVVGDDELKTGQFVIKDLEKSIDEPTTIDNLEAKIRSLKAVTLGYNQF